MTVLKRIGILSAAVFLMTGMTELSEHCSSRGCQHLCPPQKLAAVGL